MADQRDILSNLNPATAGGILSCVRAMAEQAEAFEHEERQRRHSKLDDEFSLKRTEREQAFDRDTKGFVLAYLKGALSPNRYQSVLADLENRPSTELIQGNTVNGNLSEENLEGDTLNDGLPKTNAETPSDGSIGTAIPKATAFEGNSTHDASSIMTSQEIPSSPTAGAKRRREDGPGVGASPPKKARRDSSIRCTGSIAVNSRKHRKASIKVKAEAKDGTVKQSDLKRSGSPEYRLENAAIEEVDESEGSDDEPIIDMSTIPWHEEQTPTPESPGSDDGNNSDIQEIAPTPTTTNEPQGSQLNDTVNQSLTPELSVANEPSVAATIQASKAPGSDSWPKYFEKALNGEEEEKEEL